MALDIFFREDVARALQAADEASATTAAALQSVTGDPRYLRAYRQGYRAVLATLAVAFGLSADEVGLTAQATDGSTELKVLQRYAVEGFDDEAVLTLSDGRDDVRGSCGKKQSEYTCTRGE